MALHRKTRVPSPSAVRTAASTLFLTGVASAATVLVLSQASSTFTGTWPDRAGQALEAGALPPITVPIGGHLPSPSPTGVRIPVEPAPTPTPSPVRPSATPTAQPVEPAQPARPTHVVVVPTPTPPPTRTPTQTGTGTGGGSDNGGRGPAIPPTRPHHTVLAVGEAGIGGGKMFTILGKSSAPTKPGSGEAGHLTLCVTKSTAKQPCSIGYDNSSPVSPVLAAPATPRPVPVAVVTPTPSPAATPPATPAPVVTPAPTDGCSTDSHH